MYIDPLPDFLYKNVGPRKSEKERRMEIIQRGWIQQKNQGGKLAPKEGQDSDRNIITTNVKQDIKQLIKLCKILLRRPVI